MDCVGDHLLSDTWDDAVQKTQIKKRELGVRLAHQKSAARTAGKTSGKAKTLARRQANKRALDAGKTTPKVAAATAASGGEAMQE